MAVNKVIYGSTTLIDLSADTVTADKLLSGYTAHDRSGSIITGTAEAGTQTVTVEDTVDSVAGGTIRTVTAVDISDTTATAADVASGKYFYTAAGVKTEGTVLNKDWTTKGIAANTEPNGDIILSSDIKSIEAYAFGGKKNITSVTGSEVTKIGKYAFVSCGNFVSGVFPKVTRIDDDGFHDATGLITLDVRNLTSLVHRNFQNCTHLTTFVGGLYKLPSVGQDVFNGCSSLPILVLPALTGNSAARCFRGMTSLTTIDLGPGFTGFTGSYNFQNSTSLNTIILRNPNQVVSISNLNEVLNTPFASDGTGGILYVPNNLITNYQSAANWSIILGYTNNSIKSIESTATDPTAPIDLTIYYADGTLISSS